MTPEEYIKQLKRERYRLKFIENEISSAIDSMERRLKTGYELCETSSKISVGYAFGGATTLQKTLASVSVAKIEY